ncbi:MAG: tetratricopeptide repeat protein [Eubacteriales bacterium]|nr:tetratricopeptide repeat protein [Eubacteriales bacterium]
MSGYILCQIPRTSVPYYIESISTNIYSIEELCYFFHHNLYLIDKTILNQTLYLWIKEQLGLKKLCQKLQSAEEKSTAGIRDFVYPVFKEINYLSYEDMKEYENQVAKLEKELPYVRLKMKGDCLVENGMYVNALKVYQELLQEYEDADRIPASFIGNIYHNAGCAYSYLFQKEEALECFEKSYHLLHTEEALHSYLLSFYNGKTSQQYQRKLEELGVEEQTKQELQKKIDAVLKEEQPSIPDSEIDGMIARMVKEYHRSTGS